MRACVREPRHAFHYYVRANFSFETSIFDQSFVELRRDQNCWFVIELAPLIYLCDARSGLAVIISI